MPQMSPLGWAWLVLMVILGYFMVMLVVYFLSLWYIKIDWSALRSKGLMWMW